MVLLRAFVESRVILIRKWSEIAPNHLKVEYLTGNETGIVVFGLNRPEQKNAFNKTLIEVFNGAIGRIEDDSKVRVLVIRSLVPNVFCAGADLKERLRMATSEVAPFVSSLRRLFTRISRLAFPTIAAIDSTALGGGLELVLACDLRYASTTAKLGLVETKLGIIPGAGGTQRLPRLINPSIAKELIFTGRVIGGKQALDFGVITRLVEQNSEGNAAFGLAMEVAKDISQNGGLALKMAKLAIDKGLGLDLNSGLEMEEMCYERLINSEDRIEGLKAFQEKRKPSFKGC